MKSTFTYIFWTCRNQDEAQKIIHLLLDQRLIACASILPEMKSIYRWEGKVEESIEVKVILKTQPHHFQSICDIIKTHCSYEVPEIVQVDPVQGNPQYISWVIGET